MVLILTVLPAAMWYYRDRVSQYQYHDHQDTMIQSNMVHVSNRRRRQQGDNWVLLKKATATAVGDGGEEKSELVGTTRSLWVECREQQERERDAA